MVQRSLTPGGDKNGADINLALDALEMAFTHPHINAFVIVGGDSELSAPRREAQAVRRKCSSSAAAVHERHHAAEMSRVHRLREPAGVSSGAPAAREFVVSRVSDRTPIEQRCHS